MSSDNFFMRSFSGRHIRTLTLIALGAVCFMASSARAETIDALKGLKPLGTEQLASYHAGFSVNGLNINIGFNLTTLMNGQIVQTSQFSTGPLPTGNSTLPPNFTTIVQSTGATDLIKTVAGQGSFSVSDLQNLVQASGSNVVVSNTANNAVIQQVNQITLAISGLTRINLAGLNAIRSLMSQVKVGLSQFH